MDEYIEREAAQKNAFRYQLPNGEKSPKVVFINTIDKIPAADVAPVRHGKWIDDYGDSWRCSDCGAETYVDEDWRGKDDKAYKMNFCHYCGAKMDGDNHG